MNKRKWLEDIRTQKKYSQEELSKRTGISISHYSMIECGERNPSVDVAKRIAAELGFDWTLFFDWGE